MVSGPAQLALEGPVIAECSSKLKTEGSSNSSKLRSHHFVLKFWMARLAVQASNSRVTFRPSSTVTVPHNI